VTTIEIRFVGGRYHATPWGRHVNEGEVAWPPEPWRVLRALIATWHLKADHERFKDDDLSSLIDQLASDLPQFALPRVTHSHVRSYMPIHEGAKEKRTLVFDGFLQLHSTDALVIHWAGVTLDSQHRDVLQHLLSRLGYFGRAESWCEARLTELFDAQNVNCVPVNGQRTPGEIVDVLAPMTPDDYGRWRRSILQSAPRELGLKGKKRQQFESTVPPRLVDLLRLDTSDFQAVGWSHVPGGRKVPYVRPEDWNVHRPVPRARTEIAATTIRFALAGRPLPRIEQAIKIGELARVGIMAQAKKLFGEDAIPSVLSGRDNHAAAREHQHAFFLPEDSDGDGWIDHILVHADGGLGHSFPAVQALRKLWTKDGNEWTVLLEWFGTAVSGRSSLVAPNKSAWWRSITPYLHPWFRKKSFDYAEQITKELALRDIEVVEVRRVSRVVVHGKELRPIHFHRFRSRGGLPQPDRQGAFFELELREPIAGPLALGFGCHYGLGLFSPVSV
jgi:CRISPR-associated protein Csb2